MIRLRGSAFLPAIALLFLAVPLLLGQTTDEDCLACHRDPNLKSRTGQPVAVDAAGLAASAHGRAGLGCLDCHAGLSGTEDFPLPVPCGPVDCSPCHEAQSRPGRTGFLGFRLGSRTNMFHGISRKPGETRAAGCVSCHGHHGILPSSDPSSPVNPANLPGTCGACHPGVGDNVAKGRIHTAGPGAAYPGPAIAETVYSVLIVGFLTVFLAFIGSDLWRRWRER